MKQIEIKYRTWYKGVPPRPIKLEIPGWSGQQNKHKTGDQPQPWHCLPFVEGSTYGLELIYPFETECHVKNVEGKIVFEGDFTEEQKTLSGVSLPPFSCFAPGHFGMTSGLDIKVPEDHILRLEPHPRFYTDSSNTVPCCIVGHLQTEWWPRIFFVVFKNPSPGQTLIFRKNEPYGQILILPKKIEYKIKKMSAAEELLRIENDKIIDQHARKISNYEWVDHAGHTFNDKYKVLSKLKNKHGIEAFQECMNSFAESKRKNSIKKITKKLFMIRKQYEGVQNKKKKL
jgi:hypothetical protein